MAVLSAATAVTLATQAAHAVTLSLYYGQDSHDANSNNGVFIGTKFLGPAGSANAAGQTQGLGGQVIYAAVSNTTTTTIGVPVGQYLSLSIDALLTGNHNPYAGQSTGQNGQVQPSFLGLNELGIALSSSDAQGQMLTPVSSLGPGMSNGMVNGLRSYPTSGVINQLLPANGGASIAPAPT